jgi:hypothetical protein
MIAVAGGAVQTREEPAMIERLFELVNADAALR